MSDQAETSRLSAPEAAAALNGSAPAMEQPPADTGAQTARKVTLTWRAVEQIDMRVETLQIELAILVGVMLLVVALEIRRSRQP